MEKEEMDQIILINPD